MITNNTTRFELKLVTTILKDVPAYDVDTCLKICEKIKKEIFTLMKSPKYDIALKENFLHISAEENFQHLNLRTLFLEDMHKLSWEEDVIKYLKYYLGHIYYYLTHSFVIDTMLNKISYDDFNKQHADACLMFVLIHADKSCHTLLKQFINHQ